MSERYVSRTIEELEPSDRVALDIGANQGQYTFKLAEKFREVHAFEPHPNNLGTLQLECRNKRETHKNIVTVGAAIALTDGLTRLYINDNPGGHSINEEMVRNGKWGHDLGKFLEVACTRLDTYCEHLDVGFIKCDVESGENFIFESGVEMLKRCRPTIILEVHNEVDLPRLHSFFTGLRYRWRIEGTEADVEKLEHDAHYLILPNLA